MIETANANGIEPSQWLLKALRELLAKDLASMM